MAETISILAQLCADAFYQDFRPSDGFWRQEHFEALCIAADAKLKQNEYDNQVALNLRRRTPTAEISLGSDNFTTVKVPVVEGIKAVLPEPIMMFSGAPPTLSVASVVPDGNCKSIIPILPEEISSVCDITDVVFWYPVSCGIEFVNLSNRCNAKNVTVRYIPELSSDGLVQQSRRWNIMNMVTGFLKQAKDGVVVDMSNDSNPNASFLSEINKYLIQQASQR